jgi:hypothetical protein
LEVAFARRNTYKFSTPLPAILSIQKQITPVEVVEPDASSPGFRLGVAAWVFACCAAALMVGLWLITAYHACFVWQWMRFQNAVFPIPTIGDIILTAQDRENFLLESSQAGILLLWMWLAFLVNVVANLFSQIPKRLSGRNQLWGRRADRLSTCICLTWIVWVAVWLACCFV